MTTDLYDGLAALPASDPDKDAEGAALHPAFQDLRARLERADGVLISTPEYAGALPGSFKNPLDWTVGGNRYGKPVAWLKGEVSPSGVTDARASLHDSLRKVLGYAGTVIVDGACARIPLTRQSVGEGGPLEEITLNAAFEASLETFLDFLARRSGRT